jgi:hypothetical protein
MKNEKGGHMKELDFDELHDAVNKLMVQAQKPKAKREPAKSVVKVPARTSVKVAERSAGKPTPVKDTQKESPTESPKDEGSPVNVTVHKTPAAKILPKRRGIAMDVVQAPRPTAVAPPSARAARTAPTLHPTGPVVSEPPSPRQAAPEPPKAEARDVSDDTLASLDLRADGTARPKTEVEEHKKAVEPAFPDPLDVHGFSDAGQPPAEPEQKAQEVPVANAQTDPDKPPAETVRKEVPAHATADPLLDEPSFEPNDPPTMAEPAATPFVNAKVEKRPLGAYASATPQTSNVEDQKPTPVAEKPEPASMEVPTAPAELRPEVVAVESADVDYSQPAQKEDESPTDLRHMAIPQQYHTQDKQPDHGDRPIFDTKDYHPPLQPVATAKKHTGSKAGALLTLILIILLVAAGVAAYFVATGSIDITRLF